MDFRNDRHRRDRHKRRRQDLSLRFRRLISAAHRHWTARRPLSYREVLWSQEKTRRRNRPRRDPEPLILVEDLIRRIWGADTRTIEISSTISQTTGTVTEPVDQMTRHW